MDSEPVKLLKKAARGHHQSQSRLYESYYGYCMSVALRFCSTRDEAMEVVHDSFVKMFNRLDQFDTSKPFKPWLRRIVVNSAIDNYRRNHKHEHSLDVVEESMEDLTESALDAMSATEIMEAIAQLPDQYRIVFSLYAIEGYKHEEIASQLKISVGTSKSNLSKARAKLRAHLEKINAASKRNHG